MNRAHRLIWSFRLNAWVPVAETQSARGKNGGGAGAVIGAALTIALASGSVVAQGLPANTLPSGAQITAGSVTISGSGSALTIQETSTRAAINWKSFSVGSGASVNFVQPSRSAIILNRVVGNETSVIDGALHANGEVWIINANGMLFGREASVNVGSLVASTLDMSDADFMAGKTQFARPSGVARAGVINLGTISADVGGHVALLGQQVINDGSITARLGSAVLAAGDKLTLDFNGDSLVGVTIDRGTLAALVQNRNAIIADGGLVVLSAQGLDAVMSTVVNNTGEIRAQTVGERGGRIYLLGGGASDRVEVGGTLDASAPGAGPGGYIETSAPSLALLDGRRVTTAAATGRTGTWLIDPNDYLIAASGGDTTGAQLSAALASNNVQISTAVQGRPGGGDITVNDAVTWSSGNTLTLVAQRNININQTMDASAGSGGRLVLEYGQSAVAAGNAAGYTLGFDTAGGFAGKISLQAGNNFSTKLGSDGTLTNYTVITALGASGSTTATDLQGVTGNLAGHYVLGADIDAAASASPTPWWSPIGSAATPFSGTFDGLGHTVANLTVTHSGSDNVGLFGVNSGTLRNLLLTNATVSGANNVGSLLGWNTGTVSNVGVPAGTSTVQGSGSNVGGLIGQMSGGVLSNSFSAVAVTAPGTQVGGLIGYWNNPPGMLVSNSWYDIDHSTTTVNGVDKSTQVSVGGVYGTQFADWLANGRQALNPANYFGPAVGGAYQIGTVQNLKDMLIFTGTGALSFNLTSDIDLTSLPGWRLPTFGAALNGGGHTISGLNDDQLYNDLQGFVGYLSGGVSNLTVSGVVKGNSMVGGLAGYTRAGISGTVSNVNVTAQASYAGGMVGFADSPSSITGSSATGTVSSTSDQVGGLIGYAAPITVDSSFTTGNVSGTGAVGGLIGAANGTTVRNSCSASGTITGTGNSVGGLVGGAYSSSITAASATGSVSGGSAVGGLVGQLFGGSTLSNSYSATGSVSGWSAIGGLVGETGGGTPGSISGSHTSEAVSGWTVVGGLVGDNVGPVRSSYATGTVTATTDNAGGLVGVNSAFGGDIAGSYATGNVSGINNIGGLVGLNQNNWGGTTGRPIADSHSSGNVTATGLQVGGLVGAWDDPSTVTNSFYNINAVVVTVGGVNRSNQVTLGGLYGSQYAAWVSGGYSPLNPATYFGAAVAGNYLLSTTQNLKDMLAFTGSSSIDFKLATDIDVSGISGWHVPFLGGNFDGGSHLMTGLANDQAYNNYQGLFGFSTGALANLGAYGSVSGYSEVGGLVGANSGSISNSYAATTVSSPLGGATSVGGLVGANTASHGISDSYAAAALTVNSASGVGGLVGTNDGNITRTYASGSITCASCGAVGGLSGLSSTSISASFWNTDTTGQGTSAGGAVAETTAQLESLATYSAAAWNISGVGGSGDRWRIYEGASAPLLLSFLRPLTVTANSTTRAYDGTNGSAAGYFFSATPNGQLLGTAATVASGKDVGQHTITVTGLYSNQTGYDLTTVTGTLTVTPKVLAITGSTAAGKTYDGSNTATISTGTISGLIGSETVSASALGAFDSANAGSRTATATYTLSDGSNGGLASNYVLADTTGLAATITPKALTVTGTAVAGKVYDGTQSGTVTVGSLSGFVGNETVTASGAGTFDSANAGARSVTARYSLANGTNGGLASNYSLAATSGIAATITPRSVDLAPIVGATRSYDGTADIAPDLLVLGNVLPGDPVSLSGAGQVSGAAAGTHDLTGVGTLVLSNGNYTFAGGTLSGSLKIVGASTGVPVGEELQSKLAVIIGTAPLAAPDPVQPAPGLALVTSPPAAMALSFGEGATLHLLGSPLAGELTQSVTLDEARALIATGGQGGDGGNQDVRVPVSRNSLVQIVNGGVRLPGGVQQQLFVVRQ